MCFRVQALAYSAATNSGSDVQRIPVGSDYIRFEWGICINPPITSPAHVT